jgi:hypothetical protein
MVWRVLIKRIIGALIYLVTSFALLAVVFPMAERVEVFNRSWSSTLNKYLRMSLIVTAVVVVVIPLVTWWCTKLPLWIGVVIRTGCVFAALYYLAIKIGTSPDLINLGPTARISSFFAEWRFVIFIYQYTTAASILAAVYYWWTGSLATRDKARAAPRTGRPVPR